MGRLDIDFLQRRGYRPVTALLIALGAVAMGAIVISHAELSSRRDALKAGLPTVLDSAPSRTGSAQGSVIDDVSRQMTAVFAGLRYPWGAMWNAIERAKGDVQILGMAPEAALSQRWNLTALGSSDQAMLAFLERLRAQQEWRWVVLQNEAWQGQGAEGAVVFHVQLEWRGDA